MKEMKNKQNKQDTAKIKEEKQKNNFFVGYRKLPNRDRRFLIAGVPLILAVMASGASILSRNQKRPDASIWGNNPIDLTGRLVKEPYPHILVPNPNALSGYDSVFLVQFGKYGAFDMVRDITSDFVTATGKIISRNDTRLNYLFEITDINESQDNLAISPSPPQELGEYQVRGRIVDSKCHFGVMRPSTGETHKACASLCIRGGIPPFFVPQKTQMDRVVVLLSEDQQTQGITQSNIEPILPHMMDLIEVTGRLRLTNNHYELVINPAQIDLIAAC